MDGITKLTNTQERILEKAKSPCNILVQGRSNDGKTLGLIILMLNAVKVQQQSTQILFVTATREASKEIFNTANDLSNKMGWRRSLLLG